MKNNALKSRKMAFVFVMIGVLLIFPTIGERAAAEEGRRSRRKDAAAN